MPPAKLDLLLFIALGPIAAAAGAPPAGGPAGEPPILYAETRIFPSKGASSDDFGDAVAISGETVVVGAKYADGGEPPRDRLDMGRAFVFERTEDGDWIETAVLENPNAAAGDLFGSAVGISGDTVVIGAPEEDDFGINTGAAYVFERGTGAGWSLVARLQLSDPTDEADFFGDSIAIRGATLVIGAPHHDAPYQRQGAVYLFQRDPYDRHRWTEVAKLLASDGGAFDWFGSDVSFQDDVLAVGSSDGAYVFERDDAGGGWREVAHLRQDGADSFGSPLELVGDRLHVAAKRDDELAESSGAVFVYRRKPGDSGEWRLEQKLKASDAAEIALFGTSLAVAPGLLVVGAESADDVAEGSGAGYLFLDEETPDDPWREVALLRPPPDVGRNRDLFGCAAALDGPTLVVGARFDSLNGSRGIGGLNTGSAVVFSVEECLLAITLDRDVVRPGERLTVAIALEHRRLRTVTVPFHVWLEDTAGNTLAVFSTPPLTFHHGETAHAEHTLAIPAGIPAGDYLVNVGVERMQQRRAGASAALRVVD